MQPFPVVCAVACLVLGAGLVRAEPYVPSSDSQVVERLPLRAGDPAARELAALRASWRRDPADVNGAVALSAAEQDALRCADGDAVRTLSLNSRKNPHV